MKTENAILFLGEEQIELTYRYDFSISIAQNASNSLLYTVDGELISEYNEWFMYDEGCDETDHDELAEFYFNKALIMLGK